MPKLKYRTAHLLILMSIVAISIPSYKAFKEYQHRKRVGRFESVSREASERMDAYLTLANDHRPLTDAEKTTLYDMGQHVKRLYQEVGELSQDLDPEEVRRRSFIT